MQPLPALLLEPFFPPIFSREYMPVQGMLRLRYVPFFPVVILKPLGPKLVLIPFLLRLICMPGAIFMRFL